MGKTQDLGETSLILDEKLNTRNTDQRQIRLNHLHEKTTTWFIYCSNKTVEPKNSFNKVPKSHCKDNTAQVDLDL